MSGHVPIHPEEEERVAMVMTRELEAAAAAGSILPSVGFADRVMAAVALVALPQPVHAFRVALSAGRMRAAIASLLDAWRVVGGGSTPIFVRAQALALVLVVTIGSLALAGGATVGAIDLLNANQPATPPPTAPVPTAPVASPLPSPSPSPWPNTTPDTSPDASSPPQTSETPQLTPTETPADTEHPRTATARPTPTDDHGGGSGSGGDGGGGGSGDSGQIPTPTPTETDDHGGSDG